MVHKMGVEMKCDQCDYKTVNKQHLKVHNKSIHQGVTYPCSLCGYLGTIKQSLKKHERSQHGLWKPNLDYVMKLLQTVHGTELKIIERGKNKFMSKPRQINRENIY